METNDVVTRAWINILRDIQRDLITHYLWLVGVQDFLGICITNCNGVEIVLGVAGELERNVVRKFIENLLVAWVRRQHGIVSMRGASINN